MLPVDAPWHRGFQHAHGSLNAAHLATALARFKLAVMPTEPHAPVRGRHLDALRAAALYPRGMRETAYPSAMPALLELGYVERRPSRHRRGRVLWYVTPAGRDLLVSLGEKPGREG